MGLKKEQDGQAENSFQIVWDWKKNKMVGLKIVFRLFGIEKKNKTVRLKIVFRLYGIESGRIRMSDKSLNLRAPVSDFQQGRIDFWNTLRDLFVKLIENVRMGQRAYNSTPTRNYVV